VVTPRRIEEDQAVETREEKVRFYSEGVEMAGLVYHEPRQGRRPGIVVCHGFGGLKEGTPPNIARRLASLGYVCLTFDYRGFGGSGGPAGRLIPAEQIEDIRNALCYLESRPDVDPVRLGLYGTSFGGGHVASVAAVDDRVKCLVATVSVTDGEAWLRAMHPYWAFLELLERAAEDRRRRALTGHGERVDRFQIMAADPKTRAFYDPILAANPQQNVPLTLETVEAMMSHRPVAAAGRMRAPALFIAAEADVLVPPEQTYQIYEHCGSGAKALVRLPGADHFSVYVGETFETVIRHTGEWFQRHLGIPG
jgi:pimeloyl-ACP methyl ester carboxylesterase